MTNDTAQAPQGKTPAEIAPAQPTASTRFMNKVVAEFSSGVGEIALSEFQKRLAQNYFIALDAVLSAAEEKRLAKSDKYRDPLPITWDNVNMALLARSVVAKARIGLDPAQKNHVSMVPFKNKKTDKYDIVFIDGYRGIELTAKKYGLEVPDDVIVELVYTKDHFKSIKKNLNNPIETYEFEIVDDFDRGEIKGGFYYHLFKNVPEKNKLVVMKLSDILKRKPQYASVEFWGGEKDVWVNGKKTGTEHVDGWYEKMCLKTVYRAAWGDITIDSQKIDQNYLELKKLEGMYQEAAASAEIEAHANAEAIDVDYTDVPDTDPDTGEIIDTDDGQTKMEEVAPAPSPAPEAQTKGKKNTAKQDDPY